MIAKGVTGFIFALSLGAIVFMNGMSGQDLTLSIEIDNVAIAPGDDLYGRLTLSNASGKTLEIISNGSALQFVQFYFVDDTGKDHVKFKYGAQFNFFPLKTIREKLEHGKQLRTSIVPSTVLPCDLKPGTYTLSSTFDYQGHCIRSNSVKILVVKPSK